jgi:hypothetical protein
MGSSGMLRLVALVRTDVSEELSASLIRVTRIGELGTPILVTLMKEVLRSSETSVLTRPPHGVTSHKTPFFCYQFHGRVIAEDSDPRPSHVSQ